MQYARNVHFKFKPGKEREFTALFDNDVMPLLRKQPGFREYFTLSTPRYVLGITVWEDRSSADRFSSAVYPTILAKLNGVLEGPPKVETYDVTSSKHFTSVRAW